MAGVPRKIGTYSIEGELGRGGMGVVYKGTDSRLGRPVAIKALPPHLSDDPDLLHRFEQEARTLASLNHSNVGGIYGLEEHEDRKYLVLEYIDGETLADRLARGPLRVGEALEVCAQIAEGLAAAHDAGFIHRDLKPANVKLASSGTVKILDFGLARIDAGGGQQPATADAPTVGPSGSMTTPGTIIGTPQYMSPEQARAGRVDRRADVWAWGVVLYECLTGTSPFEGTSPAESIAAVLTEEPDMTALPASTPPEVVALVGRCLRKDARRRQRDAGDCRLVLEDARDAIASEDPTARRATRISDESFCISDELCRCLDRTGFDALLPGWEMRYADNNRESDVVIVWIPSIGGDHTTSVWRELITAAPYRMVVVCPVGMEPGVANRPVVSIENQLALIRALARQLRTTLGPKKLVVTGLSCGSIMALRCAAGDESGGLFDGVLAIDPDMQESDCFVTRLFAGLDASSTRDVMNGLHTFSDSCRTVDEWLVLHQHMLECVDKVKTDLSPLVRQGQDLSAPFEGVHTGDRSPFVHYLRDAIERAGTVRCVFHDSAENRRMLGEVRMAHLDTHCLGDRFSDEMLRFIPVADHIGMMSTDRLLEQLDLIVAAL